jgi:hypothetical protein
MVAIKAAIIHFWLWPPYASLSRHPRACPEDLPTLRKWRGWQMVATRPTMTVVGVLRRPRPESRNFRRSADVH